MCRFHTWAAGLRVRAMGIRIAKWYLDVCAPDGSGAIVYATRVQWRRLRVQYSATLEFDAAGKVEERMTLRRFQVPCTSGEETHFQNAKLGVAGTWTPMRAPSVLERQPVTMLSTPAGEVRWGLMSGRAHARWESRGRALEGLGYMERLDVTLPPWELPIDELRWGRFVAEDADATWLEWKGSHPMKISWNNGAAVDNVNLDLRDDSTLRDGPLVTTVFSKVPVLRRSLPARMLQLHETKWRSRGTLTGPDGARSDGWAIHEVVRWP